MKKKVFVSVVVVLSVVGQTLAACDGGILLDLGNTGENANDDYYQSLDNPQPFTVRDLVRTDRLSGGVSSPDGKTVAFFRYVWSVNLNVSSTTLWTVDVSTGVAARVTPFAWGISESNAQWTADSSRLIFLSNRGGAGTQIWTVSSSGTDATQVTDYPLSIQTLLLDAHSNNVAFSVSIFPGTTMELTCDYLAAKEEGRIPGFGKLDAFLYKKTFIRHWDTWFQGRRNHIFLTKMSVSNGVVTFAEPRDIMNDWDVDAPTKPYGDMNEWSFSADGKLFAFPRQMSCNEAGQCDPSVELSDVTWRTDLAICFAGTEKGGEVTCDTSNPAIDTEPRFHPSDPDLLSYIRTDVPGYESSQRFIYLWRISTGEQWNATTRDFPFSVGEHRWVNDGGAIVFTAIIDGVSSVLYANVTSPPGNYPQPIYVGDNHRSCGSVHSMGQDQVLLACSSLYAPVDFYVASLRDANLRQITAFNSEMLAKTLMGTEAQYLKFTGGNGDEVGMWVLTPYNYQPDGNHAVAMLIHGGPESAWTTDWSYRWNLQMYAGDGYFVVAINFHGSLGSTGNLMGQDFVDSVANNWGGSPFQDIYLGLDYVLVDSPYAGSLDPERCVAAGASFGGFLINYIQGHMDEVMASGKNGGFKALLCHDGMFSSVANYYQTEELWFPEHEFGGPAYLVPENYERWNPMNFVSKWNTPEMIVQGEKDFRLSTSQGISMFNALQRRGVDSQFLYFPTMNHWVFAPTELTFWMDNILDFLARYGQP